MRYTKKETYQIIGYIIILFAIIIGVGLCIVFGGYALADNWYDEVLWGVLGLGEALWVAASFIAMGIFIFMTIALFSKFMNKKFDGENHKLLPHRIMRYATIMMAGGYYEKGDRTGDYFSYADDRFLKVDEITRNWVIIKWMGGFSIFIGVCGYFMMRNNNWELRGEDGILLSLFLPIFFILIYHLLKPRKHWVFDRMAGTVTIPGPLFFPARTIPFQKVRMGSMMGAFGLTHPTTGVVMGLVGEYDDGVWEMLVWYMDRNRPLPQGDAFDPYRERDFERRKSEGFPAPLYPADYLIDDAASGYIYGTTELKKRIAKFKYSAAEAQRRLLSHFDDKNMALEDEFRLVLLGVHETRYVFKLDAPLHQECRVITNKEELKDTWQLDGNTKKIMHVKQ